MNVSAAGSNGFALAALKSANQQKAVQAQVVQSAVENARQVAESAGGGHGRGQAVNITV